MKRDDPTLNAWYRRALPAAHRDLIYQARWCLRFLARGRWRRARVLGRAVSIRAADELGLLLRNRRSVECPLCGWQGNRFFVYTDLGVGLRRDALCPGCGSLGRHRLLVTYLRERGAAGAGRWTLLDVAPMKSVQRFCRRLPGVRYVGIDRVPERDRAKVDVRTDLTALAFPEDTFDLILCFHVLEHVREETRAVAELARVLGPEGLVILDVPVDWSRPRTADFGPVPDEQGHFREYGGDLIERLREGGLEAEADRFAWDLDPSVRTRHGLPLKPLVLARKPGGSALRPD